MSYPEKLPSGKWRGVYRLADGTKRSKTFTHKRAAERWAAAEEQKVADGRTHDPHAGRIRWGEWRLRWFPARSTQASTTRTADSRIRCHLAPRWDDVALNAITTTDAQAWVTSMTRSGMPSNSVRGTFHLLSGSMRAAVRDGLIPANPCTGVRLPPLPAEPERFLTFEETEALLAVLRGPYRVLVELLLESGMRLGEAVSLHRHRIDFESRRISVVESWGQVDRAVRTHTKWGHSRVVPMSNRLEAVLLEWLGYSSPPRGVGRCAYKHEEGERCRSELAILGPRGAMIDPTNFTYRVFAKGLKDSGIGYARTHDLRHTWASRLITAGVPLQRLQRWGGWESYEAMRRYAKLMDSGDDDFRTATDMGPRGAGRGATSSSTRSRRVPSHRPLQPS